MVDGRNTRLSPDLNVTDSFWFRFSGLSFASSGSSPLAQPFNRRGVLIYDAVYARDGECFTSRVGATFIGRCGSCVGHGAPLLTGMTTANTFALLLNGKPSGYGA
jgi:hypothetical protein